MVNLDLLEEKITLIFERNLSKITLLGNSVVPKQDGVKKLTLNAAIEFLSNNGFKISRSTIYKLTARNQIPHSKFCNKLVFDQAELETWILSKLVKGSSPEIDYISKSAINKLKR